MENNKRWFLHGLFFIVLFPSVVNATIITADLARISGNTWQADYSIENDSLASDIEAFAIYFDLGLYENIVSISVPPAWDPLLQQPDAALPDDGVYDVLALASGITPGGLLTGFVVSFDWLGVGMPGSQFFEIIEPVFFAIVDSGQTTVNGFVTVPESGTMMLMFLSVGLIAVIFFRRKSLAK